MSRLDEIMDAEDPKDDVETGEENKTEKSVPPAPTLEERLAALEKENSGLKSAVSAERDKRHQFEGRYKQLHETVVETLSKREAKPEEPKPEPEVNIELSYDDDGNPYIPASTLKEASKAELKELREELARVKNQLAQEQTKTNVKAAADAQIESVLSENPEYVDARKDLEKAYNWVVPKLGEYIQQSGKQFPPGTTLGSLIEFAEGSEVEKEFVEKFSGYDFERVLRAYTTKRDLRLALNNVLSTKQSVSKDEGITDTLKALAGKPSSLSGARNQKTVEDGPTLADLAKLAGQLESMSDAEAEKFKAQLAKLSE